jgi:hypothetical protein
MRDLLNSALALGVTFTAIGILAVWRNEGPVGVRHPFELSGLLGTDRRKAVVSHLLLLFGLACLAAAIPLWMLVGFGY